MTDMQRNTRIQTLARVGPTSRSYWTFWHLDQVKGGYTSI